MRPFNLPRMKSDLEALYHFQLFKSGHTNVVSDFQFIKSVLMNSEDRISVHNC